MKKAILYVASILIAASVAAAPGSKLIQKFSQTFPNAKSVKWIDDKAGYFVSFTQNGNFNKVFYDKDGGFVYSLKYTNGDDLPANIKVTLNEKFETAKILGVTEVTTSSNTVYNVKFTKDDKLYCLDLLTDGSVVKQEDYTYSGN